VQRSRCRIVRGGTNVRSLAVLAGFEAYGHWFIDNELFFHTSISYQLRSVPAQHFGDELTGLPRSCRSRSHHIPYEGP